MGTSQYPRRGYRLAPRCLQEILDVKVSASQIEQSLALDLKLRDLDESTWSQFSKNTCRKLGQMIVRQTSAQVRLFPREILNRPLPVIPSGIQFDDLELESRTRNCLQQIMSNASLTRLEELRGLTVEQLLHAGGFGAKCLVDLLTSLEGVAVYRDQIEVVEDNGNHLAQSLLPERRFAREAACLRNVPSARSIRLDDPRLAKYVREVFRYAISIENAELLNSQNTIRDLADRIAKRSGGHAGTVALSAQIRTVRRYIAFLSRLPLEKELRGIVAEFKKPRAAGIFLRHQGWDGSAPCTLHAAGALFGVTGAAAGQVCADLTKSLSGKSPYLPCLDETLAFVRAHVPANASDIERALTKQGLTRGTFRLEGLLGAARFFNRPAAFKIVASNGTRVAISQHGAGLISKITRIAERAMNHAGAATFSGVARLAKYEPASPITSEFVSKVLELRHDLVPLGRESNWFWLSSVRNNPLVKMIRKVLSVSPRVDAACLLAAVSRSLRPVGAALSREVLLEFCRRLPMCFVFGDTVSANGSIDPQSALCDSEYLMLQILKENGSVLRWGTYRALCLQAGINQNTFSSVIRESPIIAKYPASLYGIVGVPASISVIETLATGLPEGHASIFFDGSESGELRTA